MDKFTELYNELLALTAKYATTVTPQAKPINITGVPPAQSPEEALQYLRSGLHIDGTPQWTTQADLDAATVKAQAWRAAADPAQGNDPDLWEAFGYIGEADLVGWKGRTWADYFNLSRKGTPSG